MFLLFEEAGKFMAGRVLSETESSAQVELDSGKRVKVKVANFLVRFEKPSPAQLQANAQALAETIELELAWEFSPEDEFGFAELARDYFSDKATLEQQAGMLLRLFEAPHYFRRAGKGRFRKAPADIIAQALARPSKRRNNWRCRPRSGRRNWVRANARRPCATSSTRFCSSRTRTRPSTRRWSRLRAQSIWGR